MSFCRDVPWLGLMTGLSHLTLKMIDPTQPLDLQKVVQGLQVLDLTEAGRMEGAVMLLQTLRPKHGIKNLRMPIAFGQWSESKWAKLQTCMGVGPKGLAQLCLAKGIHCIAAEKGAEGLCAVAHIFEASNIDVVKWG